jgi:hypothetical protein
MMTLSLDIIDVNGLVVVDFYEDLTIACSDFDVVCTMKDVDIHILENTLKTFSSGAISLGFIIVIAFPFEDKYDSIIKKYADYIIEKQCSLPDESRYTVYDVKNKTTALITEVVRNG